MLCVVNNTDRTSLLEVISCMEVDGRDLIMRRGYVNSDRRDSYVNSAIALFEALQPR